MKWEEWSLARLKRKTLRCIHHKGDFCVPVRSHPECLECYNKDNDGTDSKA
jgi:hypothetical protein